MKSLCFYRNRVNEQTSDTDGIGRMDDPVCGVLKEAHPQPNTVLVLRHRKPCEHHNRNWIGHILRLKRPGDALAATALAASA